MKDFLTNMWLRTKFYWAVGKMYAGNYWTAHRGQILRVLAAITSICMAVYFRHALYKGATIMFSWLMSHASVLPWGIAIEALLLGVMLVCLLFGMEMRFKPDPAEQRWLISKMGRRLRLVYVHALWVFLPGAVALGLLAIAQEVIPGFPHKGVLAVTLWVIGAICALVEAYAESVPHPRCTEEQLLVYPAPPPPPPEEDDDDKGKDKKKVEPPSPPPQEPKLVTVTKEHMPMASMGLAQCDEDQVGFVTRFRGYAFTFSPTIHEEADLPVTGGLLATFWPIEMLDRRLAIQSVEVEAPESQGATKKIRLEPTPEERHPWTMPYKKWINVSVPSQGITNASGQKVMVKPFIRYRVVVPEKFRYRIGNFKESVVAEAFGAIFMAVKPMTTDEMVVRSGKTAKKVQGAMDRMFAALDAAMAPAEELFGVEIDRRIEDFEIPEYSAAQTTFLRADAQARGAERLRKAGVNPNAAFEGQTFTAAVEAAKGSNLVFLQNPLDAFGNTGRGGGARTFDDRGRGGRDEETRGRPKREKEPKKVDLDAETGAPAEAGGTTTTGDTATPLPEGEEKVEDVL